MTLSTTFRYTLQSYAGPASRYTCPACGKPGRFTRYLDTDSGELLPDAYGRCDRQDQCGYFRSPYHDEKAGEAVLPSGDPVPMRRPKVRLTPPTVLTIPADVVTASLHPRHYPGNALAQLLRTHFGWGVADELHRRFRLGTSAYWPGACVFWLFDEQDRARGGQVVLYDASGHTVKMPFRHTRWAHTALAHTHRQSGTPLPAWLADYAAHGQKSPCLFGLPQLDTAAPGQRVIVVESAKTAMVATPHFPEFVWLATMGKDYLTEERMRPLKNRPVYLLPDAGAFDAWKQKAEKLSSQGYSVKMLDWMERVATAEERTTGLDLADVLLREWPGYPPGWDVK